MIKKNNLQTQFDFPNATIQELFKNKSWKNLFVQVDISSVVFFRILFGLLMFYEVTRYFSYDWIAKYWIEPKYHFTYWPFDFLKPLPGNGMYWLFYLMGFLSVCIVVGLFYRLSIVLFFLSFSYVFLLEQTRYLNHFYLLILISFVMIFIPANTSISIDNKIFKKNHSETIAVWTLWLLRFMIGLPYFFGGVAKINSDWLHGQPLKIWLASKTSFPVIGKFFHDDWMIYFMAYSGLLLDLLIVPALLFRKTRKIGFIVICLFHLMNSELFSIGIFPWFMIAATSLFFYPDWFRKLINIVTGNKWKLPAAENNFTIEENDKLSTKQKIIIASLLLWVSIQCLLPIRHFFINGNVHWTEEGHRYAWHMKLRTKSSKGFYVVKNKENGQEIIVTTKDLLTGTQKNKVGDRPYLIWQFCQIIKNAFKEKGYDVAVYAHVQASLNGRKYQPLVDSTIDLTSVPRPIFPAKWILPLTTPLNGQLKTKQIKQDGDE